MKIKATALASPLRKRASQMKESSPRFRREISGLHFRFQARGNILFPQFYSGRLHMSETQAADPLPWVVPLRRRFTTPASVSALMPNEPVAQVS